MSGAFLDPGVRHLAAGGCGLLAVIFLVVGAIGMVRFADVYERIHAMRAAALAAPLLLAGLAIEAWDWRVAVKLALIAAAMALTGPSLAHLIAHAAHRAGIEPASRARDKAGARR